MSAAKELTDKAAKDSAEIHETQAAHAQKSIADLQKEAIKLTQAMAAQQMLPST